MLLKVEELLPEIVAVVSGEMATTVREALSARFGIATVNRSGGGVISIRLLSMDKAHKLEAFKNFADGYLGGYVDGLAEGIAITS